MFASPPPSFGARLGVELRTLALGLPILISLIVFVFINSKTERPKALFMNAIYFYFHSLISLLFISIEVCVSTGK